jgi:proline iminopeptidase
VSAEPITQEANVQVGPVHLYTRTVGSGPVSVVLHGGPGAHHDYLLPYFDGLATGRTLRYYDQRGGGRSEVDRDVSVDWRSHVDDLAALLDIWQLQQATIVGYSWGGLLAMLFATTHPGRVTRLALVSPAPATAVGRARFEREFAERSRKPEITQERDSLRASDLRTNDPDGYRRRLFELSVTAYFHNAGNVRNLTPFRITGRTQQAVWQSLGEYDLRDLLSSLSISALILHGRHDPIPLDTAQETATLLNGDLVVMEQSGHVPYVEDYERFREELDAFLPKDAARSR